MLPGKTILSGASPTCSDCGVTVKLQVCRSNAGFYVGSYCKCGPYSRESGYFASQNEAEMKFKTNTWEPR